MDKDRKLVEIRGHTQEDKNKCIEMHLADLYKSRHSMIRPEPTHYPYTINAYGEVTTTERKKISASFIGQQIKIHKVLFNVEARKKDEVFIEFEIVRTSGILDSYSKTSGKETGEISVDVELHHMDIVNIYMTYKPENPVDITKAAVIVTVIGDISI